jgi:hypothetical protein
MTGPTRAFAAPPRLDPAYTAWNTVISYDDYASAQRAVDRLSDDSFPVEHLDTLFGFLGHAATRGARDFASARTLVATRYDIVARDGYLDAARSGLQQAGLLNLAA